MEVNSCVYRISRAEKLQNRVYTIDEISSMGCDYFHQSEADPELVEELLPYCRVVKVKAWFADTKKIRDAYGLSDACQGMEYENGDMKFTDPESPDSRPVLVTVDEIRERFAVKRTEPFCFFRSSIVTCWREDDQVRRFSPSGLKHAEVGGFYRLSEQMIREFNRLAPDGKGGLPVEKPTDDQALFCCVWE